MTKLQSQDNSVYVLRHLCHLPEYSDQTTELGDRQLGQSFFWCCEIIDPLELGICHNVT